MRFSFRNIHDRTVRVRIANQDLHLLSREHVADNLIDLDGTQFSEELFALREYAMREAPGRIAKLTSAFQYDSKPPLASSKYKSRIEAFALAAVKETLDAVINQWLRGDTSASGKEHAISTTLVTRPEIVVSPTLPNIAVAISPSTSTTNPLFIDPKKTTCKFDSLAGHAAGNGGTFDHILSSSAEGTKAWTGGEGPSGLDWLSMVADMNSKSWDEDLMTCLDSTLQQPFK